MDLSCTQQMNCDRLKLVYMALGHLQANLCTWPLSLEKVL